MASNRSFRALRVVTPPNRSPFVAWIIAISGIIGGTTTYSVPV
jgi:hypothetical protein